MRPLKLGEFSLDQRGIRLIVIGLCIGIAGADWLDVGSDNSEAGSWFADPGSNYGEIGSWFSDPIFFSSPTSSLTPGFHDQYYPYFGEGFFRSPVQPVKLGGWRNNHAGSGQVAIYPYRPIWSEFRNRSLENMEWPASKNNWTHALEIAQKGSSFKVIKDRKWTNP
jgi:hypothetical protein